MVGFWVSPLTAAACRLPAQLVLDEAHVTKNPAVGHSKACMALRADRRWLCTGACPSGWLASPLSLDPLLRTLHARFLPPGDTPWPPGALPKGLPRPLRPDRTS